MANVSNQPDERRRVKRLGHKISHTGKVAAFALFEAGVGRHRDYGQICPGWMLANTAGGLQAVHAWHLYVHQHSVKTLLCQLIDGERTVAALGDRSGISQPSLSQQLAVLRTEGLVATRRDGKHVHYRVASPAARAILTTLHEIYCIAPNANASDP